MRSTARASLTREAPGQRDPVHAQPQDALTRMRRGRVRPPARVVQECEQRRVGEAEVKVGLPPGPQVVDRVDVVPGRSLRDRRLGGHVGRHHVLGHCIEQAVLVAEQPVDRRPLYRSVAPREGHRVGVVHRTLRGMRVGPATGPAHQCADAPTSGGCRGGRVPLVVVIVSPNIPRCKSDAHEHPR